MKLTTTTQLAEREGTPSELACFDRAYWNFIPNWRWELAIEECDAIKREVGVPLSPDFHVQQARRLQVLMSSAITRRWVREKWRDVYDLYRLGTDPRHNTMRAMLDIEIIKGSTEQEAMDHLLWLRPGQYTLYSRWFFDLSGIHKVNEWMDQNVFRPLTDTRRTTEMASRMLAYQGDYEGASKEIFLGGSSKSSFLAQLQDNERAKHLLDYITRELRVPPELYIPVMETALKSAGDRRYVESGDERKAAMSIPPGYIERLEEVTSKLMVQDIEAMKKNHLDGVDPMDGMAAIREDFRKRMMGGTPQPEVQEDQA